MVKLEARRVESGFSEDFFFVAPRPALPLFLPFPPQLVFQQLIFVPTTVAHSAYSGC